MSASSRAVRHVDLVQRDHPRPVVEPAVRGQLGLDRVEVAERVAAGLEGGAVDDVHQRAAALDVAQELQAEALALAGARDQAGDVGDGEARPRRPRTTPRLGTSVVNG